MLRHGARHGGCGAPCGGTDRRGFFIRHACRGAAGAPILRVDEGDAEALPYPDRSFDAVVANLGIHHVSQPGKAVAEALRVLRPGGRLAFTTWATPADNVAWRLLFDAIRAHGDMEAAAMAPPSGGNLGTSEAVLSLLRDAGFGICLAAPVRREWLVDAPRDIVVALASGTVRTAALIAAQPSEARQAIERRRSPRPLLPMAAMTALSCRSSRSSHMA